MKRAKKRDRRAYSAEEIADFARLIRTLIGVHNRHGANLLEIFALLQTVFPRLRLKIVANELLPRGEARAYPEAWIIKITQGVFDGLLAGLPGARWTFAHELGHVLLRHPGSPYRDRDARDDKIEREAHIFAAEFLSPSEHVIGLKSVDEVQKKYQISFDAAQRRLDEVTKRKLSKQFGTKRGRPSEKSVARDLTEVAARTYSAISDTISEFSTPFEIRPFRDNAYCNAILVAKGAQLLADAYESVYGAASITEAIRSACLVAAIVAMQPIRRTESSTDSGVAAINQNCALGAVLDRKALNEIQPELEYPITFPADYLSHLLVVGKKLIRDSSSVIQFVHLPSYCEYIARIDVTWTEIHALTNIANLLALLKSRRVG